MLTELLAEDGFKVKRKGAVEFSSPCPACGGEDRFIIRTDGKERFWCRRCDVSGDKIDYLRVFRGMNFQEAASFVGRSPGENRGGNRRVQDEADALDLEWRKSREEMISFTNKILLENTAQMDWVLTHRGLTRETVQRFRLGWLFENLFLKRSEFGVPDEMKLNGEKKKLFIPAGLVIPGPNRVRIRRSDPGKYGKYYVLPGSGNSPLIIAAGPEFSAIVVESELDAMLLAQELREDMMIIAAGSTSNAPGPELIQELCRRPYVLVAFDNDEAGAMAAWQRWIASLPNGSRLPLPASWGAKDPTEAYLKGYDLNAWLQAAKGLAVPKNNRPKKSTPVYKHGESGCPEKTRVASAHEFSTLTAVEEKIPGTQSIPAREAEHQCPMQRNIVVPVTWCDRVQYEELCGFCQHQMKPPRERSVYQEKKT